MLVPNATSNTPFLPPSAPRAIPARATVRHSARARAAVFRNICFMPVSSLLPGPGPRNKRKTRAVRAAPGRTEKKYPPPCKDGGGYRFSSSSQPAGHAPSRRDPRAPLSTGPKRAKRRSGRSSGSPRDSRPSRNNPVAWRRIVAKGSTAAGPLPLWTGFPIKSRSRSPADAEARRGVL